MLGDEQGDDDAEEARDTDAGDKAQPFLELIVSLDAADQPDRLDHVGQDETGADHSDPAQQLR